MSKYLCPLCTYNRTENLYRQKLAESYELSKSDIFVPIPSSVYTIINYQRFSDFLNNVNNKIVDSVRIITHDIEGEPYINNLFYDGKSIIYIDDASKISGQYGKPYINTYQGDSIKIEENEEYISYYLQNKNVKVVQIFYLRKRKNRCQY